MSVVVLYYYYFGSLVINHLIYPRIEYVHLVILWSWNRGFYEDLGLGLGTIIIMCKIVAVGFVPENKCANIFGVLGL